RPRRTAHRGLAGGVGTCAQIAGDRFGVGTGSRNSREPGARRHRVSGQSSRSGRVAWCGIRHVVAWTPRDVDSSAARIVGESFDPAARGVTNGDVSYVPLACVDVAVAEGIQMAGIVVLCFA